MADCPFHHGQEIWYDDDMSVGAQYVACPGDEVGKRGKGKGGESIHGIGKVLLLLLIEQIVIWKGGWQNGGFFADCLLFFFRMRMCVATAR